MKKKLMTLVAMWGIDLFFLALIGTILMAFFPNLEKSTLLLISIIVSILIGAICLWFTYIYCIVHVCKNSELSQKQKVTKLLLVVLLSVFYTPIYYTKYVIKDKKWLGILKCILYTLTYSIGIIGALVYTLQAEPVAKEMDVVTADNLLVVELNDNFTCETEDIGGYKLYCSNNYKDEAIGIFNYDFSFDTEYILEFHTDQLIDSYKELGYTVKTDEKLASLRKVEVVYNSSTYYIVVEVKEFNKSLKSVLVYSGEQKEAYKNIFSSVKQLQNN